MLLTMRVVVVAPISASYHAAAAGLNTRGAPVTTVVTAACAPDSLQGMQGGAPAAVGASRARTRSEPA
jgi:hypothetical protein